MVTEASLVNRRLGYDPPIAAENYFQERTRRMRI